MLHLSCGRRYGGGMSYEDTVDTVAKVVEAIGVTILTVGGLVAFVRSAWRLAGHEDGVYRELRQNLGRVILLGLEVLIIGDIVRTIVVEPSLTSVGVLGIIVVIRIVLSFSLEVEIDGVWPWSRWRLSPGTGAAEGEV
jgi:uncharacterized membrane protein